MSNQEIHGIIIDSLKRTHGEILRIQKHDAPEWFGDGWLVSFEVPKRAGPIIRVAFFRNEEGKPVLANEIVVRDADGKYPPWRHLGLIYVNALTSVLAVPFHKAPSGSRGKIHAFIMDHDAGQQRADEVIECGSLHVSFGSFASVGRCPRKVRSTLTCGRTSSGRPLRLWAKSRRPKRCL
jgi:hypothetical protein